MTVKEAIKQLQQLPEDLEIVIPDTYIEDIGYPRNFDRFGISYLGLDRKYLNNIEHIREIFVNESYPKAAKIVTLS